jgi:hypothetical protein
MITLEEQIEAVDKLVAALRDKLSSDEVAAQCLEAARGTLLEVDARLRSGVFCRMFPQCVRLCSKDGMMPECRRPSCPGLVALTAQGAAGHEYDIGGLIEAARPAFEDVLRRANKLEPPII